MMTLHAAQMCVSRSECVIEQKGESAGGYAQGRQVRVADQSRGKG